MRLFHLSDLHIGKTLNGYSLLENQRAVLNEIIEAVKEYKPEVVLISGDVYDRTVPSGEAYEVLDEFLYGLSSVEPSVQVLLIAGNHDSPERLAYASSFLEKARIHMAVLPPATKEEYIKKVTVTDEHGPVNFYLLPFLKPGYVKAVLEQPTANYGEAIAQILAREQVDKNQRNVLLSHQFYVGKHQEPETCQSEQTVLIAGGLDQVDAELLNDFDYVALGHLHGPQQVGKETVRYCGTPYKYSISEEHHKKSITMIDLLEKNSQPEITLIPLRGKQDVRTMKGTLKELLEQTKGEVCHDFVSVTLTDEEEPYHYREQLLECYDHLLEIRIDNSRTKNRLQQEQETLEILEPMEVFGEFFGLMRGRSLDEKEYAYMEEIFNRSKEEQE